MILLVACVFMAAPAHAKPTAGASTAPAAVAAQIVQMPWSVRCDKATNDVKEHCEAFQVMAMAKTGQRVAEFAVGYTGTDKSIARGVLILPLGILLTDDLVMQADNGKAFKFKIRYCTTAGCYAFLYMKQAVLDTLRSAKTIKIDTKTSSGQDVAIEIQMNGFSESLKKL